MTSVRLKPKPQPGEGRRWVGAGQRGAWSPADSPSVCPGFPLIAAHRGQSANVRARHFPGRWLTRLPVPRRRDGSGSWQVRRSTAAGKVPSPAALARPQRPTGEQHHRRTSEHHRGPSEAIEAEGRLPGPARSHQGRKRDMKPLLGSSWCHWRVIGYHRRSIAIQRLRSCPQMLEQDERRTQLCRLSTDYESWRAGPAGEF